MNHDIVPIPSRDLDRAGLENLPTAIARAGEGAAWRFVEFFTANIRNRNTRAAYAQAVAQFFRWCEARGISDLDRIKPVVIAAYIEQHAGSSPTVKQHLAAIRMLFDWLVTGQVMPVNPASSVRGPKYVVTRGKTPVLKADQARTLLDSIETGYDCRPPGPGARGFDVFHLCARECRRAHASRGLLPERQALVVPVARKRRQAP